MIRIRIEKTNLHLEELLYLLHRTAQGALPNTKQALKGAASLVRGRWVDFAKGGPLKGIAEPLKRPSGAYAKSIKTNPTGPFEYEIYSDAKVAELIENGTEQLDMKTTHPYGPRSRMSKEGFPYLIVPFRWGTPKSVGFKNVMPVHIYNMVKKLKKTKTTVSADQSSVKTSNYRGEMVGRARYEQGGRFDYALGNADFNGMVRSTDSTGKNRSGGYFTFRVISAKQLVTRPYSWIKPAMPARHVTKALVEETREGVNKLLEAGLMGDLS